jgi:methyltransferase (TIGR00027 family)
VESERPDRLFHDGYARKVAGERGFALLERYAGAATAAFVTIRTAYLDRAIIHAVAERGIRQVVFVAAGMDTRPLRLPWPDGVTVYELDRAELIRAKTSLLPDDRYPPACDRRRVPVDLTGSWATPLREAGFTALAPTLWVVEGLLFFLDEQAVRQLLIGIRELSGVDGLLVGDLVSQSTLDNPLADRFLKTLAKDGAPWRFGTDQPEDLLAQCGWKVANLLEPGQDGANFGRWPYLVLPRETPHVPRSFLFTADAS